MRYWQADNLVFKTFQSRVLDITQEREGWLDSLYLDLKNVFDKVPKRKLPQKLENNGGLKGKIKKWMKDYIAEREMRMLVRDEKAKWRTVTGRVPQGLMLALIWFLVYGNDKPEHMSRYISICRWWNVARKK